MSDRPTVHMVGNAHLDAVWLWPWEEGYAEVRATFASALDRMDEDPDFTFACDSVAYYAWIEEHDQALFDRIRRRVHDGRWELAGGWWVEPDCNIPGGEALVRQGLYGQRFLASRFGMQARIGMNVDPFGHAATLPQILRGQGLEAYVFFRPISTELALPGSVFRWRAPDGTTIPAYRLPHEYSSGLGVGDLREHLAAALAARPDAGPELMVFYGVGNHGGGPTRANIASVRRLAASDDGPAVRFSTMGRFFERVAETGATAGLPEVDGELQHHAVGCYSAHSEIKALNRRAEVTLAAAERWSAVATAAFGIGYPLEALGHAWRQLCFNQFHDILAGTAIEPAYVAARDQLGESLAIAARAFNRAVQAVASRIDIEPADEAQAVVVVNRVAWPVDAVVEVDLGELDGEVGVVDAAGARIAAQLEPSQADVPHRGRLVFPARLPALGYRLYRVRPVMVDAAPGEAPVVSAGGGDRYLVLQGDRLRAVIDRTTGWLEELADLASGTVIRTPDGAAHAVVHDDPTDTWSHGAERFGDVVGAFVPTSVRLVRHGPVRAVVLIESSFGRSTLREELVVAAGVPYLEVRVWLDWQERHRVLKLRVPAELADIAATFEIPFGAAVRPAGGREEPGQSWVDMTGRTSEGSPAGVSVLTDAKYAYDVDAASIGITAARSPAYAWHAPAVLDPAIDRAYQDQGVQRFRYAVLPHAGSRIDASTARLAAAFNAPPVTLLEGAHPGDLPAARSFADVGADGVGLAALKAAEDGSGDLVARLVELHGTGATTLLDLSAAQRTIEARLGPYQVRTYRLPADPRLPVTEVDLLEEPAEPATRHRPVSRPA